MQDSKNTKDALNNRLICSPYENRTRVSSVKHIFILFPRVFKKVNLRCIVDTNYEQQPYESLLSGKVNQII